MMAQAVTSRRQSRAPRSLADIEFGEMIGAGVFGKVYVGHNKSTGEVLAIKEVSGRTVKNKLDFLKEASVLRKVRHPYLLRLRAIFVLEYDASVSNDALSLPSPRKSRTTRWLKTIRGQISSSGEDYSDTSSVTTEDAGFGESGESTFADDAPYDSGELEHENSTVHSLTRTNVGYKLYLVTEYCEGGSLNKLLDEKDLPIPWETRIRWIYQAACGLQHLHNHNVVHRDLKADNCLLRINDEPPDALFSQYTLVLADFGLSRFFHSLSENVGTMKKPMTVVGTPWLMAPELMNPKFRDGYTIESEIFTFGVLMLEIVTRRKARDIPRNPHTLAIDMFSVREMTIESNALVVVEEIRNPANRSMLEFETEDDQGCTNNTKRLSSESAESSNAPSGGGGGATGASTATKKRDSEGAGKRRSLFRRKSGLRTRTQSVEECCPAPLLELASDCVELEPNHRPCLEEVIARLEEML